MNWIWNLADAEEVKEKSARNILNSGNYYVYKANGVSNSIKNWEGNPFREEISHSSFVAYEKARLAPEKEYFEVVRRDANGDPVLDDEGAVDAYLTGVLPSAEVLAAEKSVETEHLAELDDGSGRAATGVVVP